jgi:caffeoyl-CoA O-methyltransferase
MNIDLLLPGITEYAEMHSSPHSGVLGELERATHLRTLKPLMVSGHHQGRLLSLLSHLMRPKNILELGTFTGYAAICLAEGLAEGGKLLTIEGDEELESIVRKYIGLAQMEDKIEVRFGDILQILPELDTVFDLVFIDANKKEYDQYYELILPMVAPNGLIVIDNILWKGKVLNPQDRDSVVIDAFNKKVQGDSRVENVLLPIRDGLMLVRKLV